MHVCAMNIHKLTCIRIPVFNDSLEDSDSERWGVNICKGANLMWLYMSSSDMCQNILCFEIWSYKNQQRFSIKDTHSWNMLKPSRFSSHWSFFIERKHIVTIAENDEAPGYFLYFFVFWKFQAFSVLLLLSNGSVRKKHGKDMSKDKRSIQKLRREAFIG